MVGGTKVISPCVKSAPAELFPDGVAKEGREERNLLEGIRSQTTQP
jgi:hypothetical protein